MIKVTDTNGVPTMTAIGYTFQNATRLKFDLAERRKMLEYVKPEPRLKCIGNSPQGLIFVDLDDWADVR